MHDVLFEGDRAVGVRVKDADGDFEDVPRQGRRGRQRPERPDHEPPQPARLGSAAQQGRDLDLLEGRLPGRQGKDAGATLVIQTGSKKGWFWYIPLHDDVVSCGVVAPFDYLFKGRTDYATDLREEV